MPNHEDNLRTLASLYRDIGDYSIANTLDAAADGIYRLTTENDRLISEESAWREEVKELRDKFARLNAENELLRRLLAEYDPKWTDFQIPRPT